MPLKVELINQSFQYIKAYGGQFAASFYENLFRLYPESQQLFADADMEAQQAKLWDSLVAIVLGLRYPQHLTDSLKGLGARHIQYGALPEHYPLVGEALLTTFEQYLGEKWTKEVKQAWVEAYHEISKIMLAGAEYNPQDIKLETEQVTNLKTTPLVTNSSVSAVEMIEIPTGEVNWRMTGGVFVGAGLVTTLLAMFL